MKPQMSKQLTALVILSQLFFGTYLLAQDLPTSKKTWSDQLINVETDPVGNNSLVHSENHLTNQIFNQSKNKNIINAMLSERLGEKATIQKKLLSDKSEIKLIDRGLGKSIDLIQTSSGIEKKLLSNFDIKKNNSVSFISFSISPDEKTAIVFAEKNGSIDDYQLYVFDLVKSQTLSSNLVAKGNSVVWTMPNKFSFTDPLDFSKQIEIDILNNFSQTEYSGVKFLGQYPVLMKCEKNIQKAILNGAQEVILNGLNCRNWSEQIQKKISKISVIKNDENNHHEVLQYVINPEDKVAEPTKIFEFDGVLQQAQFIDDHFFLQTSWGADQQLIVLDEKGTMLQTVLVPAFASVTAIEPKNSGTSVNVTLETVVTKDEVFELDYLTGKWLTAVTADKLLKKINMQYVSEVVTFQARDGVQIPLRLTRLSSTKLEANTPVLIDVYGGFGKPSKIYPQFNFQVRNLFLNKGGVYATPAIRGGGDYGDNWYKSAAGLNKMVSLNDIIDTANFLIQSQWTSKDKIIITGTSNGGFSVAAAALLSPSSFGLVIPISGVYDILGINRLDSRFARYWWNDYGNPNIPAYAAAIQKFSPLEIDLPAVETLPNFLFVNGLNDSRVNSLHSLKMIQKIRLSLGDTDKVHALFLKNAGHWIASQAYEDFIALRENSIMWDFVYKQLGW